MTPAINDWPPSPLDSATHRQHQLNRKDDYKRSLPGGRRVSGGHWFHFHFGPSSSFHLSLSSHYSTHGAGRGRRHRDLWPAPSFRGWSSKKKKMEEINEGSEWTHEGLWWEIFQADWPEWNTAAAAGSADHSTVVQKLEIKPKQKFIPSARHTHLVVTVSCTASLHMVKTQEKMCTTQALCTGSKWRLICSSVWLTFSQFSVWLIHQL